MINVWVNDGEKERKREKGVRRLRSSSNCNEIQKFVIVCTYTIIKFL